MARVRCCLTDADTHIHTCTRSPFSARKGEWRNITFTEVYNLVSTRKFPIKPYICRIFVSEQHYVRYYSGSNRGYWRNSLIAQSATRIHILNTIHCRWTVKTEQKIWIRYRESIDTKVRPKVWGVSSQNRKKMQKDLWTGNDELSETIFNIWISCSAREPLLSDRIWLFRILFLYFNPVSWRATLFRFLWTSSDFYTSAEWVQSRPAPFSERLVNS